MNLINGDFRDYITEVIKEHKTKLVIVSDPPFNIGYNYNLYKDKMEEDGYYTMLDEAFGHNPSVVVHYPEQLYKLSFQIGKFPERVISWVYNSNTTKQHRDIAFFDILPNMKQIRQEYKNLKDKRIKHLLENGEVGAKLYDWWEINQVKNINKEKTEHPCQMPEKVMQNIIGILPYNCVILDPFMGSGTTGVAVIEMNRQQKATRDFIGIEIDEKYYKIAEKRIKDKEKENIQIGIEEVSE